MKMRYYKDYPFVAGEKYSYKVCDGVIRHIQVVRRTKNFIVLNDGSRYKFYKSSQYINEDYSANYELIFIKTIYGRFEVSSLPLFP